MASSLHHHLSHSQNLASFFDGDLDDNDDLKLLNSAAIGGHHHQTGAVNQHGSSPVGDDPPPPSINYYGVEDAGCVQDCDADDDISRLFMVTAEECKLVMDGQDFGEDPNPVHHSSLQISAMISAGPDQAIDHTSIASSASPSLSTSSSSSPSSSSQQSHHQQLMNNNMQNISSNNSAVKLECDQCGFACSGADSLRAHMAAHLFSERPYACQDCNKRFREKRTLADHRRIHTGEKPFKCPLCPAKFRQIPHCNRHLKTHQGNAYRPYDCDVCGKSFARKFGLALHQRDHALQFPFKCNLCDKIFAVIEQLGEHFRREHKK